ncbi:e3 ubiquitin ligase Rnf157 [Trichonephila inaurata madagascariensis]|uniref:RING-type E3 ubiquitin transferase n=1 Tax=Trichonephila inaurata madagascariensis TaxID=2747483 RepID=A0A8X6YA57_9ARAC|nr:e3 ubiquitin ligase Rnf157 [Trichonephila inaurata madagascariensis]
MGLLFSRENARIEELDSTGSNAYSYPPRSGKYFASHFIMGGEKFQTQQPEAYLFGENMDLNFLGGKPSPFPYAAPQPNEPTKTLRSLINIRKETLRFVKPTNTIDGGRQSSENVLTNTSYNIEFSFDSDIRCSISIFYFCTEEITTNAVIYTPRDASLNSETYHYKKGINQQFSQVSHIFDPSKYSEDQLNYKYENEVIPVLIQCIAEEGEEPRQSHMVIAIVEKNADDTYTLKPLKQKLFIDGILYLLQEIYGIENKNVYQSKNLADEDVEDTGFECVICMSDHRDTLILPCRHLCLCNSCADSLRYQANNCPICRAPFRALLSIRAVRRSNAALPQISHNAENQPSQDIPHGFEPISLIEALNGPLQSTPLVASFVPAPIPSFTNSPDIRRKPRHIERHHSSSASLRLADNSNSAKDGSPSVKLKGSGEVSSVPEVMASILPSDKMGFKTESLSLTRGEGKRHKKGFRTSSAPEKIRLLANSMQIVNEVGTAKWKLERDAELAETRSLLENNTAVEDSSGAVCSPKTSRPCSRSSPISLSTPHSLHLCERSSKDTSPGGEDSDYFTPEDPSTTILVDQGTDTSLDTPQGMESGTTNDFIGNVKGDISVTGKNKFNRERHTVFIDERESHFVCLLNKQKRNSASLNKPECNSPSLNSPNSRSFRVNLENPNSLPGTPDSTASNHSSGDSFSSTSSMRLLLGPQNYETLLE